SLAAPLPRRGPGRVDDADEDGHAHYEAGIGPGHEGCLPAVGQQSAARPLARQEGPGFPGLSLGPYPRLADGRPLPGLAAAAKPKPTVRALRRGNTRRSRLSREEASLGKILIKHHVFSTVYKF